MVEPAQWRSWPKVCKGRSGAANTKSYRGVMLWQPITTNPFTDRLQGWTALGTVPYSGPVDGRAWWSDNMHGRTIRARSVVATDIDGSGPAWRLVPSWWWWKMGWAVGKTANSLPTE